MFWGLLLTFKCYSALISLTVLKQHSNPTLLLTVSIAVLITIWFGFVHMPPSLIKSWINNALFVRYLTKPLQSTDLELGASEFPRKHCF